MTVPTSPLSQNLAKGIWYRRLNGSMFGASLVRDDAAAGAAKVRVVRLDPSTLEEMAETKIVPLENFFCFYCRRERLAA